MHKTAADEHRMAGERRCVRLPPCSDHPSVSCLRSICVWSTRAGLQVDDLSMNLRMKILQPYKESDQLRLLLVMFIDPGGTGVSPDFGSLRQVLSTHIQHQA